jgi:hypothetical protein
MHGVGVGCGVYSHGMNAHLAASAMDAKGDFAPIGYENFFEQG